MDEFDESFDDDSIASPEDSRVVTPSMNMLIDAARIHGIHYVEGADRLVMPWELHRHILAFVVAPRPYILSVAQLRCTLALSEINAVMEFLSTWNGERINPTGMFQLTDLGEVSIQFRNHLPVGSGVSMQQLCEFMSKSADTAHMAMDELRDSLGESVYEINDIAISYEDDRALRTNLLKSSDVDVDPDESDPARFSERLAELLSPTESYEFADESTTEVTVSRIASSLVGLGIEKSEEHDGFLITAINGIFIAAFIDNGPSLLVRGHWDCNLDVEKDKLRTFLVTNDWNNSSPTTRALWVEEEAGLQLRVEYAIPMESGLTDSQLSENLVIATHDILRAIHELSTALAGTSAVQWPD